MSASVDVRVVNFDRVLRGLRDADEVAYKEIEKALRDVAVALRKEVRDRIPGNPVSNWGPWAGRGRDWSQSDVKASVGFAKKGMGKRSRGLAYEVTIGGSGKTPAGSIWALMGSGRRTTTTQGEHLVEAINSRFPIEHWRGSGKQGPRGMVEAYYAAKSEGTDEQIAQKIATALERAVN